jgi:hypothetical protein
MSKLIALLRGEPALLAGTAQTVLSLILGFGVSLTVQQTGGIEAAAAAAGALIVAAANHPFRVGALTGFVSAAGTVLIAWKVPHITAGTLSAANALLTNLVLAYVSLRVTPKAATPAGPPPPVSPAPGR